MPRGEPIPTGLNEGHKYELKINNILKEKNLQDASFKSPLSDANSPDGYFYHQGKTYNIEIKLDLSADFGQLNLNHNGNEFVLPEITNKNQNMHNIIESLGIIELINQRWTKKPRRFSKAPETITQEDKNWDMDNFTDIKEKFKIDNVSRYYENKDIHYIQIGNYGFYYLLQNPANLPVPKLLGNLILRVRIKTNNSKPVSRYSFLVAMKVENVDKSNYNLEFEEKFPPIKS